MQVKARRASRPRIACMATPVQAWHDEHMEFEALLNELQRQVDIFHGGGRPDYERMLQVLSTLRERGDRSHHPREDVAFERLAKRCPDLALELARLQQEHRVIARAGERLHGLLSAALDEAVLQRAEVEIAAAMYLVYYGNHIAHEEETILGRAASALSAEDWDAVRKAAG
jgi:hemerythrin-like domain-containing protein